MEQDLAELEKGLNTMIGTRGVKLSGGQAQRTAAARMFVRDPELLVCDDLSSALDVETERTLWDPLREARKHLPDRLASPPAIAARRPHHRAQKWSRRGHRHAR